MGLNRFVIHTSVHQPLVDKGPGLSLGPFGQWFTRNETWAEQATPWVSYLARSSYLLQQGRFVADIVYFYGEDTNVTALFQQKGPAIPDGYNFDYVNADALMHRFSASGGRLATPSGMQYRVLALDPNSRHMSLPVLRSIEKLVSAGAVVVGPKPMASPSLSDSDAEFHRLADDLWGAGDGSGEHRHGAGSVYGDATIEAVLSRLQVPPDFVYTKPKTDTTALFVHRTLPDADVYFVNNRQDRDEDLEATFRVSGREAEIWHADSGRREPAPYRIAGDRTTVPLHLDPWGAVFVVFRKPASAPSRTIAAPAERSIATIAGPWTVRFQADRGAPDTITLDTLKSWSENADPGVKYFSGSATYSMTVDAPAGWFVPGAQALDRSRRGERARGGVGQRQAGRHCLEATVPCGRHQRAESRRQRPRGQGDQPLGEPDDWRPPAECAEAVHLHPAGVLQDGLTAAPLGAARARSRGAGGRGQSRCVGVALTGSGSRVLAELKFGPYCSPQ